MGKNRPISKKSKIIQIKSGAIRDKIMEIKATIKQIGEVQQITENFSKAELIINTGGEYPKDVCIEFGGKHSDKLTHFGIGETVVVSFDPESREHNGRWYTSLRGWKIESQND